MDNTKRQIAVLSRLCVPYIHNMGNTTTSYNYNQKPWYPGLPSAVVHWCPSSDCGIIGIYPMPLVILWCYKNIIDMIWISVTNINDTSLTSLIIKYPGVTNIINMIFLALNMGIGGYISNYAWYSWTHRSAITIPCHCVCVKLFFW